MYDCDYLPYLYSPVSVVLIRLSLASEPVSVLAPDFL